MRVLSECRKGKMYICSLPVQKVQASYDLFETLCFFLRSFFLSRLHDQPLCDMGTRSTAGQNDGVETVTAIKVDLNFPRNFGRGGEFSSKARLSDMEKDLQWLAKIKIKRLTNIHDCICLRIIAVAGSNPFN